jgi:hypothetical protein
MMGEMASPPQVFTLEAVNALVPRLTELVGDQLARRADIERALEQLAQRIGVLPEAITIDDADPDDVRDMKREIATRVEKYQGGWRELELLGAVLKDPRMGLLDFYGEVDGKRVWLCWKYGEDAVMHYHGLDEGFSGRKPIEPTMRHRHLN